MKLPIAMGSQPGCPSPPMRGRGLKPFPVNVGNKVLVSPPMRGRGLKHTNHARYLGVYSCRPPCGGVD